MTKQTNFRLNGEEKSIGYGEKATKEGITAFAVTGRRWFQKSAGNTYHVAVISALIGDTWQEIGKTEFSYGYGDQYLVTAGEWLVANGWLEGDNSGYGLAHRSVREAFNVEHYAEDVKRKRDL